jgi:hypothetical protein
VHAASGHPSRQSAEIRERAERRTGELLIEMRETGERDAGLGGDRKSRSHDATVIAPPKLVDLGITKTQSSRWQAKAKLSDEEESEKHVDRGQKQIDLRWP